MRTWTGKLHPFSLFSLHKRELTLANDTSLVEGEILYYLLPSFLGDGLRHHLRIWRYCQTRPLEWKVNHQFKIRKQISLVDQSLLPFAVHHDDHHYSESLLCKNIRGEDYEEWVDWSGSGAMPSAGIVQQQRTYYSYEQQYYADLLVLVGGSIAEKKTTNNYT